MIGYMYILECADGSYYTGSTTDLERRLAQHQCGEGANHTKNRLPVKLIYYEKFPRIDQAFYREKQVQGWCRKKKEALINGCPELLPQLAVAYRDRDGGFECLNHREDDNDGGFECLNHREDNNDGGFKNLNHRQNLNHREEGKDVVSEALEDTTSKQCSNE